MKNYLLMLISGLAFYCQTANAQCTEPGVLPYGTAGTWIGYVYNNTGFTSYAGTITRGGGAMNFDESFGGNNGNWTTSGTACPVDKSSFSIRFKLRQEFHGAFRFTVGADEGVRFSLDGGATWVINDYTAHTTYRTVTHEQMLDGFYNMVIEYYDISGANRVSFNITTLCMGSGTQTDYGTNNVWNGYIYDGMNFNVFKGRRNVGASGNPNFYDNYGGDVVSIPVTCPFTSETFSARYKLRKTFPMGNHLFTIGGDDGYRLSLDGGATWFINRWVDQPLTTFSKDTVFSGEVFMVLEFYENLEDNILDFSLASVLPITLLDFEGKLTEQKPVLQWRLSRESTPDHFTIERSSDGRAFTPIGEVSGNAGQGPDRRNYNFIDPSPLPGKGFYRLHMVDVNGSRKYSSIVTINTNIKNTFKIYPTIIDQSRLLFVRSYKNLPSFNVTVVNIAGQKMMEKKFGRLSAGQSVTVPVREQGLPSGTYVVQVYASGELLGKQMIVVQ